MFDKPQKLHQKTYFVVLSAGIFEFVPKLLPSALQWRILGKVQKADPPFTGVLTSLGGRDKADASGRNSNSSRAAWTVYKQARVPRREVPMNGTVSERSCFCVERQSTTPLARERWARR